ncbi:MFS domain-containing protein [Aphelenchoides bicaudatus]|nr:MFS domain-containing protein [Aphelenchoides bicaudatus]
MALNNKYRYYILLLGCLCMTSISSNMYAFNIAQICMATPSNETTLGSWKAVDYAPSDVSFINGVVGAGTMIGTIPSSGIYARYGLKTPFVIAGILSALTTALQPFAAEFHLYAMLVTRFIQGVTYAAIYPAIAILSSRWAAVKQTGLFICVYICYTPLSSGLTNVLGGIICNHLNWALVYFSHALIGFIIFGLWLIFFDDHPHKSSAVSKIELEKIQRDKTEALLNGDNDIPYKEILSDIRYSLTNFLFVYAPYYISNVLGYSTEETGFFSAIASTAQIPLRLICGILSDRIQFVSERTKMVFFNTVGLLTGGIVCGLVGFVPNEWSIVPVILFSFCNLATGSATVGFFKCGIVYARQYSSFICSTCQFIKCFAVLLGPGMVAVFVHDKSSREQWRIIFLITSAALISASLLFVKFCSATPAPYTAELPIKDQAALESLVQRRLSKEDSDNLQRQRANSLMSLSGVVT